ncbi:hypothetical protein F511_26515 [Dorcoceras hygrometricum]|uniref:Uncharacterized protein n=1 Tax=Dorcoceras hygrometricum TaxID=472368 RepID=A0A2Z7DJW0_9LAMI|nr:hypothetical protein F511_26515 [Dorcoceras hygrometricum]
MTGYETPSSACTRRPDEIGADGFSSKDWQEQFPAKEATALSERRGRRTLGKWVYLVTLAMSLFNLQDVCIDIGSLATLDLPMVVDLIGIYVLKGPYCTLTTTNWFLQALSVIPRGSWDDVARCFTMIRWVGPKLRFRSHNGCGLTASCIPEPLRVIQSVRRPLSSQNLTAAASTAAPSCRRRRDRTCSDRRVEEIPFVPNSSGLLVQADEGVVFPVVDLIKEDLPPPTVKSKNSL